MRCSLRLAKASYGAAKIIVKDEDWQNISAGERLAADFHDARSLARCALGALADHVVACPAREDGFHYAAQSSSLREVLPSCGVGKSERRGRGAWREISALFSRGCYFRLSEDGHGDGETGSTQSETFKMIERRRTRGIINPAMIVSTDIVDLEPFTRALGEFVTSPAYKGVIDFANVSKLI
jgi:hypothetical protein